MLCKKNTIIGVDAKPQFWSIERLRQMKKEDHELSIQAATGGAVTQTKHYITTRSLYQINETIYSTLFEVVSLPIYVYGAPYKGNRHDREWITQKIVEPDDLVLFGLL